MSAPRLTKAQKNKICELYVSGVRLEDIAERFGIHHSYPSLLAKRRKLNRRNTPRKALAA